MCQRFELCLRACIDQRGHCQARRPRFEAADPRAPFQAFPGLLEFGDLCRLKDHTLSPEDCHHHPIRKKPINCFKIKLKLKILRIIGSSLVLHRYIKN